MLFWNALLWALVLAGMVGAMVGYVVLATWLTVYREQTWGALVGWVMLALGFVALFGWGGWSIAVSRG